MDWERKREEEKERANGRERGKVWDFRERSSTFSLKFSAIGLSVSDEARSKVAPHGCGYQFRGVSTNSRKGRGFSPTCFTFCLRVM